MWYRAFEQMVAIVVDFVFVVAIVVAVVVVVVVVVVSVVPVPKGFRHSLRLGVKLRGSCRAGSTFLFLVLTGETGQVLTTRVYF